MATFEDHPYLPPLPPSPRDVRNWHRRRWRRSDALWCFLAWFVTTAVFVWLRNLFNIPLPGR